MIPNGTRFVGIATSVDLKERKSAVLNKTTEPFTIEDIAEFVGPGMIGPQGIQGEPGAPGAVGPAGLEWKGEWISGTSYLENDAVGNNNGSYFCILDTSSAIEPYLDTTHWALLALQGAVGPTGEQGPIGPQGPGTTGDSNWSKAGNDIFNTNTEDVVLFGNPISKNSGLNVVGSNSTSYGGTNRNKAIVNFIPNPNGEPANNAVCGIQMQDINSGNVRAGVYFQVEIANSGRPAIIFRTGSSLTERLRIGQSGIILATSLHKYTSDLSASYDSRTLTDKGYVDSRISGLNFVPYSEPAHNVGINTITPNASAQLDVTSTTKGFLPPRMTTIQRTAITSPANGLVIYNTDYNWLDCYNGANWYALGSSISGELGIVDYSYTGTLLNNPIFVITAPPPALASGYVPDYSGKWVSTITLPTNNPSLQTFTFVDLQGIMGSFTANSIPSLTALNFPALTQILGSFSPGTFTSLSTITVPLLTYVGGSFTPNGLSAFVSMAYPVLHDVVGSFSPTNLAAVTSFSFPALTNVGNFQPSFMAGLTAMTLPSLTTVTGTFSPNTMSALASMTFASLSNVANGFTPNTMSGIVSMSCPSLTTVGGNFAPSGMNALTNMSFPALANVGGSFSPSAMDGITLVSFPNLYSVGIDFAPTAMVAVQVASFSSLTHIGGTFGPNTMNGLTSLTVPALVTVGGNLAFSKMDGVYVLTFPSLTDIGGAIIPSSMVVIEQIFLGAIERIGVTGSNGTVIALSSGTPTLTVFSLGSNLKQVGNNGVGNVIITSAVLGQVYVDQLLVRLAALDGTNGTISFNNRIVTIKGTSATPSPTGLAAKATLQARGCVVTHN